MHIRPYVDLSEPRNQGSQTPGLEPFARCGRGETAELPVLRPYEDPHGGHHEDPHGSGYGTRYGDQRQEDQYQRAPDESAAPTAPAAAAGSASRHGRHRRRKGRGAHTQGQDEARPGGRRPRAKAAFAAAVVVTALGVGLLTMQATTDDGGGGSHHRNFSTDDSALPDVPSGGPTAEPSHTDEADRAEKPSKTPTSRTTSGVPRADRDGVDRAEGTPAPSDTPSSASGTPDGPDEGNPGGNDPGPGDGGQDGDGDSPQPSQEPTQPGSETPRPGDSSPEDSEVQQLLNKVGDLEKAAPEVGVSLP